MVHGSILTASLFRHLRFSPFHYVIHSVRSSLHFFLRSISKTAKAFPNPHKISTKTFFCLVYIYFIQACLIGSHTPRTPLSKAFIPSYSNLNCLSLCAKLVFPCTFYRSAMLVLTPLYFSVFSIES